MSATYAGPTLRELVDRMRDLCRQAAATTPTGTVSLTFVDELLADLEVRIAGEVSARVDSATTVAVEIGEGLSLIASLAAHVKAFLRGLTPKAERRG